MSKEEIVVLTTNVIENTDNQLKADEADSIQLLKVDPRYGPRGMLLFGFILMINDVQYNVAINPDGSFDYNDTISDTIVIQ